MFPNFTSRNLQIISRLLLSPLQLSSLTVIQQILYFFTYCKMTPHAHQPDCTQLPAQVSNSVLPQDHEKRGRNQGPCFLPKWTRYAAVSLHLLVMSSSIAIIALVAHSLRTYFHTRNIKFGGINASWPKDLNLQPAYFFLVIASTSLAVSLGSSLYSFLRRNSLTFSIIDAASAVGAIILAVLWTTGDVLQYQSEKTPKRDVLSWSCRRSESPTNTLVGYASTCTEQVNPSIGKSCFLLLIIYRKRSNIWRY